MDTTRWMQPQYLKPPRRDVAVIRWGAVCAAALVGLASQMMISLLVLSTGSFAEEVTLQNFDGSQHFPWGIFMLGCTVLLSSAVSGYCAARFSGRRRISDGSFYGLITWALFILVFALLATSNLGLLFGGIFTMMARIAPNSGGAWWIFVTLGFSLLLSIVGGIFAATAPSQENRRGAQF